ncbi:MAG TPA: hypothetical protein VND97_08485 [Beijerinckiaceae bacterium]|nr:hypothetical protein [Beijerinckiaceae bacterium]
MTATALTPAEIQLLDDMRRLIRATPYERKSDEAAERAYEDLPGAAHSNAIEGNPLTAVEYAFQLLMIEERVPADRGTAFVIEFMRREDAIANRSA